MRFYMKLILFMILFACASSSRVRGLAGELAYDARVMFVLNFGSDADHEALMEDTRRMHAAQSGGLELYEAGKRYRELIAEVLADAERRHVTPSEDDIVRLQEQCARRAFGPMLDAMKTQDSRERGALAHSETSKACHPECTREGSAFEVHSQILREYAQDDRSALFNVTCEVAAH